MALTQISTNGIKDANVNTADIADNAVVRAKLVDNSVNSDKLATDAVQTANIANAQVTTDKIANNSVTTSKIADMPTGRILGRQASGTGDPQFLTATEARSVLNVADGANQTTINNNADNRLITGSGTANTLEAESNLTYNGTRLTVTGDIHAQTNSSSLATPLRVHNGTSDTNANTRLLVSTAANGGGDPYIMFDAGGSNFVIGNRYAGTTNNVLCIGEGSDVQTVNGMFIQADGDVGIGTSSPQSNGLTVERSGGDTRLQVRAGSNGASGVVALRADGSNTQLGTWSNHDLKLVRNTSEIASVTANGITFNGDTAAANALDDYEEGTWTVVVKPASNQSAFTYGASNDYELRSATSSGSNGATSTASYTKIGNRVFISFSIYMNTSGTSRLNFSLPYAIKGNDYQAAGHLGYYKIAGSAGVGFLGNGLNSIDIFELDGDGNHPNLSYATNSEIYINLQYETN